MEPEPQYPVDAITTEAMKASEPVGMDMSLDDIVKQHRVANKKRGDGKLSRDERLKVKAGVNKGGPGRTTSGGRGAASNKVRTRLTRMDPIPNLSTALTHRETDLPIPFSSHQHSARR